MGPWNPYHNGDERVAAVLADGEHVPATDDDLGGARATARCRYSPMPSIGQFGSSRAAARGERTAPVRRGGPFQRSYGRTPDLPAWPLSLGHVRPRVPQAPGEHVNFP